MNILVNVFVRKFYERNTGLLALVFYAMFGIVESNQLIIFHQSLIFGILSSPPMLLLVMFIWLLYALKFLQLIFAELAQPQNQFFGLYATLPLTLQFQGWLVAVSCMYMPVLLYSIFIVWVGFVNASVLPAVAVIAFHLLVLVSASTWIIRYLRTLGEKQPFSFFPALRFRWRKPFPFFYISFLFNEIPLALLLTKTFSLFCLFGFLQIPLDHYENRVALLGFLFGLMAHAVIVFECRKLEAEKMTFLRGLPIPVSKRFAQIALAYACLILPEVLFLAVNHVPAIDLVLTTTFGVFFLTYLHLRPYDGGLHMDKHQTHTFMLFLLCFAAVLFNLAWPTALVLLATGFYNNRRNYYCTEAE